jgi:imidazolonepropionase-like amidohydrolase
MKRVMVIILLALLLTSGLLAGTSCAGTPAAGGIEGTVTDLNDKPVAGMRVGIVSGTTGFPEMAPETNEEGYYQIRSVPPGTFEVAVHDREGNRIGLESVVVKSGETSALNFIASAEKVFDEEEATGESIAFTNVNVIPMDKERVLQDQTVIVREGRISEIGPASSTKVPRGANEIDLGQAWNVMFPPQAQFTAEDLDFSKILFPYVANGVATVEVMSALPDHLTLRDQIARGEVLGPRLILSRMIDAPEKAWPEPISIWVADAAAARQAVLDTKEAGYDRMKVYSFLNQESYDSIMATAKEVGMPVDGHIPNELSVEYILDAGQNHIVHAEEIMKKAKGDYSPERIDYFAEIIAGSDTWLAPTLVTMSNLLAIFDDHEKELARPEVRYAQHPMQQGIWSYLLNNMYLPMPPEHRQNIRDGFELFQRPLTKALQEKGAKLLTGTDTLLPTLVEGFALHRELEEMVAVGLTPYQALRTSTTNQFEFLGELDDAGTVEAGKRADLVLLEANPLDNISNTQKIEGVMIQGRWLSKTEIQTGLEEVVAYYETFKK